MAWKPIEDGWHTTVRREFLVESAADTENLPECDPGSVAYTADLSFMAMYDGETWVEIGGDA